MLSRSSSLLLVSLLLVCCVYTVDPNYNCRVLGQASRKIYFAPNELQALDFSENFRGYNLNYEFASTANGLFSIIPPVRVLDQRPVDPVPENSRRVGLSILSSQQRHWQDEGVSMVAKGFDNFKVTFATLNSARNLNFDFANIVQNHDVSVVCFDVDMVAPALAIANCQKVGTTEDRYFLLNRQDMTSKQITFTNGAVVNKRKSVVYRIGSLTFLMVAIFTDGVVDPDLVDQTYVTVYKVDKNAGTLDAVFVIDAAALNVKTLSLTDIEVDAKGFVYLTDINQGLFKFAYSDQNTISFPENFPMPGSAPRKIATVLNSNLQTLVVVATDTKIVELNWSTPGPVIIGSYEFPKDVSTVEDLLINNYMVVLETDKKFYFYKLGDTNLDNLLYSTPSTYDAFGLLDQYAPQGILVGKSDTKSYAFSNGFLLIERPTTNSTVKIIATSDDSNVTCQAEFVVFSVDDTSKIYVINELPQKINAESPVTSTFYLDDYFNGQNIAYTTLVHESVHYNLKHIDDAYIDNPPNLVWETITVNNSAFYRTSALSVEDDYVYFELCVLGTEDSAACTRTMTLRHGGDIVARSLVELSDEYSTKHIFAYVLSFNMKRVFLMTTNSIDDVGQIDIQGDYNITDVDLNHNFAFVTIKTARRIDVFNAGLDHNFDHVGAIALDSFSPEDQDALNGIFLPREVILSPVDTNVLFIRTVNSVAIVRVSEAGVNLVANLVVQVDPTQDWALVVGRTTILVIRPASDFMSSALFEYGIYDIYQPTFMREIDLGEDYQVVSPVQYTQAYRSNFVYVKVSNEDQTDFKIACIRLARPVLSALHSWVPATADTRFVATDLVVKGDLISFLQAQEPNGDVQAWRFFATPKITMNAYISDNTFRKNVQFGFKAKNDADEFVSQGDLNLYNYAPVISRTTKQPGNFTLPSSTNALEIVKEISVDGLFQGTIMGYMLDCPICEGALTNNIHLVNKVEPIPITTVLPSAKATYFFQKEKTLWILTDNTIEVTDASYTSLASLPLPAIGCTTWGYLADSNAIYVHCTTTAANDQVFIKVTPSADRTKGDVGASTTIPFEYSVDKAHKIVGGNGKLFVLDNTVTATGRGRIRVFGVTDAGVTGEDTLDAADFDAAPENNPVNDLIILSTNSANIKTLLVTINSIGLGYATYDTTVSPFVLLQAGKIKFAEIDSIGNYQVDASRYLRLGSTKQSVSDSVLNYTVLVTSTHGEHLLLDLSFDFVDSKAAINNVEVRNAFATYYNSQEQSVLNLLEFAPGNSAFMMSYWNSVRKLYSLTFYAIPADTTTDPVPLFAGINTPLPSLANSPLSQAFTSEGELHVLSTNGLLNVVYNISSKVYARARITNKGQFDKITLQAWNNYGLVSVDVPLNWDGGNEDGGSGGLKWYIFVIIALGVILVLGIVLGVYMKIKKNKLQKDSLLTEGSNISSNEEV